MNEAVSTASECLAAFSRGFASRRLAPLEASLCSRSWFDTVSVAVPGWNEPAAQRASAYVRQQFGDGREGFRSRLWGGRGTTSPEAAALLNGVAAHVLDFDDVTSPMRGHPSVALWPALMALADVEDVDGAPLMRAFAVGFELICKLSRAMALAHYARGWHSTSSIGTLGATLACAHLLDLEANATVHALGLAVSQCGGTRSNFGTDAKSFQAGMGNAAAVRAVLLARSGFTAAPDAIDGPFGYFALYANGESPWPELANLGNGPLELLRSGFEVKQYPMCYATHRTLDGVLALRREHGLVIADIESVDIRVSAGALTPLIHPRPTTGLQGKFSMEYAVAAALADGQVRLASFTDEAVRRPVVADFFANVRASELQDGQLLPRFADITLKLKDGRCLTRHVTTQHGAADDPLTLEELTAKGADCLAFASSRFSATALLERAMSMAERPARQLLDVFDIKSVA